MLELEPGLEIAPVGIARSAVGGYRVNRLLDILASEEVAGTELQLASRIDALSCQKIQFRANVATEVWMLSVTIFIAAGARFRIERVVGIGQPKHQVFG